MTGQDEREVLAGILIEHTRMNIERCRCGWSDLGRSHARHVADALIAAGFHLTPTVDESVLPGCSGRENCPAPAHQHGCLADTEGHCNEPEDHTAPTPTAEVKAEALDEFVAKVTGELAATRDEGIDLGEHYLYGMRSALMQATEYATRLRENGGA